MLAERLLKVEEETVERMKAFCEERRIKMKIEKTV